MWTEECLSETDFLSIYGADVLQADTMAAFEGLLKKRRESPARLQTLLRQQEAHTAQLDALYPHLTNPDTR